MGATKYEVYTDRAIEIAELFKLFAHPARVMIIIELLESEACESTITNLLEEIDLSQSSLSSHLSKMKNAGLLATRIEKRGGKCYQILGINTEVMQDFKTVAMKFMTLLASRKLDQRKNFYIPDRRYIHVQNWLNSIRV